MLMSVVFLLVHFHNQQQVEALLQWLSRHGTRLHAAARVQVAIADNSRDWVHDQSQTKGISVSVYTPAKNLGYLNGLNFAWQALRRSADDLPEWIVLTNSDIELSDDYFSRLSVPRDAEIGIVAPSILRADGIDQNPFLARRPGRRRMSVYRILFRFAVTHWLLDRLATLRDRRRAHAQERGHANDLQVDANSNQTVSIYAAHGSHMIVHREFFQRGGTLQFAGFMYGEEIHLAEQAHRLGLNVVYDPSVVVQHQGKATTDSVPRDVRRRWKQQSATIVYDAYFRNEQKD